MTRPATILVSYLEMTQPPQSVPGAARAVAGLDPRFRIGQERLSVDTFLRLYREIGGPFGWDYRLKMAPTDLESFLCSDRSRVFVLHDGDEKRIAGLAEFDLSGFPGIELKSYGLNPDYYGRGLGAHLLNAALADLWLTRPSRIWLHTDVCDHPAALRTYLRAGFAIYDQRQQDPTDL